MLAVTWGWWAPEPAAAIPYFARQYGVSCGQCHLSPPKLNAFGEGFRDRGYRYPGREARRTVPLAVWASGRLDSPAAGDEVREGLRSYINRIELISGGQVVVPWLSYFVEWRPVSLEQRADGTLRDRSGRFEDLFVTAARDKLVVTIGQYRQIEQVDVSLRPGVSEPRILSAGLDRGGVTARERAVRAFSPSGRSPAVRVGWVEPVRAGWSWRTSATVPLVGELSTPLTSEAREEASNELHWEAKGVVVESQLRRGLWSLGGHAYYDGQERHLVNAMGTGIQGPFSWTAIAGLRRNAGASRRQWSVEGQYIPTRFAAFGGRVEHEGGPEGSAAVLPYANLHFPGQQYTVRLTLERRMRAGPDQTWVEIGVIF